MEMHWTGRRLRLWLLVVSFTMGTMSDFLDKMCKEVIWFCPILTVNQDRTIGTFSQRHATFTDQKTDKQYVPLCNSEPGAAKFYPVNSPLSECGVLGFEVCFRSEPIL